MTLAMKEYGRAEVLQAHLGLTTSVATKIAAILSFAGAIEHFVERAIWRLNGIDPRGTKPDTDGKVISDLIGMLSRFGETLVDEDDRTFIAAWCEAASYGFTIRHNIAHGVPIKVGDTLAYMRNPRWEGEQRRREFGDFWAEQASVELVCDAMAVLYRSIFSLSRADAKIEDVATHSAVRALRTARSVLGEFASQTYNPSYEKY
ncbi:hypothetical protein [Sphingomonas sp. LHG3406-1]|uniref:hypothetical protein n=1 Tax=Sphingomonas sp. LHG3406-1 TaxID=2804617 RepID=UPI0026300FAF|nr:hypothetical protein [Sphingomonas sp. LHG3406-1]